MAPPTSLAIATQSVLRLVKEEKSYHKEQISQEGRIRKLEMSDDSKDENAEFVLKQEKAALAETKAIFGTLREKITEAVQKLEDQIAMAESDGTAPEADLAKAQEALATGQKSIEVEDPPQA